MRVAILSDIHGNRLALDAVLDDLAGDAVERFVCLGDAIQGGPQPAETVARLRALGLPVVMGNADDFLLTGGGEPAGEMLAATRLWSLERLSDADREYIAGFQPTMTVPLGLAGDLLCFHGSPHSFNDIIFPHTPDDEVLGMFVGTTATLMAGGHTHVQQLRRLNGSRFINPGSIGVAYDARQTRAIPRVDPWAEYALVTADDGGRLRVEFRRVPYDVERLQAIARAGGLPFFDEWSARFRD